MSSSIIKSDNGVSSGVTGVVQTAGSDGTLLLQTTTAGGTATTAVTIDNSQKVTFANTIGFGSNAGITFNNSSATTNSLLNDYETGTFTPTLTNMASYTVQTGYYTKVGNLVYINIQLSGTFTNSGGANQAMGGFPFTIKSGTGAPQPLGIFFPVTGFNTSGNLGFVAQGNTPGASNATLYTSATSNGANYTNVTSNNFGTSVACQFFMVYTATF
jgi:hypothetical protein